MYKPDYVPKVSYRDRMLGGKTPEEAYELERLKERILRGAVFHGGAGKRSKGARKLRRTGKNTKSIAIA